MSKHLREMPTHFAGTEKEKRALDTFIKLTRAAESASLRANADLHSRNLTVSQFGVIEALYHLGPLLPGELAGKILKSSGNMTTVIDNLEKRGFVQRQRREDDRRKVDILLTDSGKALVEDMLPGHVEGIVDTFEVLSPDEQDQLQALCKKLGLQ